MPAIFKNQIKEGRHFDCGEKDRPTAVHRSHLIDNNHTAVHASWWHEVDLGC